MLCDINMPEGGIHRTVVGPSLVYGAETWSTTKTQEKRLEVNEMRMLQWMCGVTRKDAIRNEHVRGSVKVAPVAKKITMKRLKWNRHVKGDQKYSIAPCRLNCYIYVAPFTIQTRLVMK